MVGVSNDDGGHAGAARRFGARWPLSLRFASEPEWLIGVGRLVTSLFAAIAIYLDPSRPARSLHEVQTVLAAYILFSLLLVLFPVQRPIDSKAHIATHAIDIVVLAWLAFLTHELTSPFFAFVPYTLIATTMRWGMAGAILGAIALESVLLVVGWPDLEDGEPELNILIMRSSYFLVAAGMLGYFGAYRDRSRHRLARLASWPFAPPTGEQGAWLQDILEHAADVLGAPQLVVLWHDQEELAGKVATWTEGVLRLADIRDTQLWAGWSEELQAWPIVGQSRPVEIERLAAMSGAPIELGQRHEPIDHVCSATFSSIRYRGRLFVINARHRHEDSTSLTEIIATRIGYELERLALMHEVFSTARFEERVRLARDLHDSVLQNLTAASLKLKAATSIVPPEAQPALRSVSALLLDQQRRIRMFVENARMVEPREQVALPLALADSIQTLREQWGCDIRLTVEPPDFDVPGQFSAEVAQLISEATANAVRHGHATRIDLAVARCAGRLQLRIADNGSGIAEQGVGEPRGPRSLSGRVADLAGSLAITRFSPGVAMLIELPIA